MHKRIKETANQIMAGPNRKPNLSPVVRNNIAQFLLTRWDKDKVKLKRGAIKETIIMFGVSTRSIYTLWLQCEECMQLGLPVHLTNRKSGTIRKPKKLFDETAFQSMPRKRRKTIRSCAIACQVSTSTLMKWKNSKLIRPHSSAIRVYLTAAQQLHRLKFYLQALMVDNTTNRIKFKSMRHTIHIDEKWFYLTRASEKYYLTPMETDPHRVSVNKAFICKIMFLCVVCRPIYDTDGNLIFDGKIGMYPFTQQVAAQRRSINRQAGTMQTKAIQSINREVTKDYLINKVLPDLKALWPITECGNINIQQDNAPAHIQDDDPDWRAAASADGFNIKLLNQPPKSPDFNVNDLGWFRALRSIQEQSCTVTVDQLVEAVLGSFKEHDPMKLNYVYLTLQSVMISVMKCRGNNNYKLPHMKKDTLLREGRLPIDLEVETQLVQDCVDYLRAAGLGEEHLPILTSMNPVII